MQSVNKKKTSKFLKNFNGQEASVLNEESIYNKLHCRNSGLILREAAMIIIAGVLQSYI